MKNKCIYMIIGYWLVLTCNLSFAQEIAVTERGDSVVLYSNGTWDYYDNYLNGIEGKEEIRFSPKTFSVPNASSKKIMGANQAYELFYNDKVWKRVPTGDLNPEADVTLQMLKGDAYAMIIYEEMEIPEEYLINLAVENALGVAPDIKVIDKEYRKVNGDTLIWMQMNGTTTGMKISYYSYYISSEKGTLQFHTFTGQNLLLKYKEEIEDLLNGLILSK